MKVLVLETILERIRIDSDRHVRHPIQNILAHGWISPQPGFQVLSEGVKPYFEYHTKTDLHHGENNYYFVIMYYIIFLFCALL